MFMSRKIGLISLLIVFTLTTALLLFVLITPTISVNKSGARRLDRAFTFGTEPVAVHLSGNVSITSCVQTRRSVDVVLLIDASNSMTGDPLNQGMQAAQQFIGSLDLDAQHVSVMQFSDSVVAAQPLTNSRLALRNVMSTSVRHGGTSIASALEAARTELMGPGHRSNAARLILLLSDGGSEPAEALRESELALKNSIPIAVVGLVGKDWSPGLLGQLATSGIFRQAQTPDELSAIFTELGMQVNNAIASDVVVNEKVQAKSFRIAGNGTSPSATVSDTEVTWHIGWITNALSETFVYTVVPQALGLQQLVDNPGEIRMIDCQGALLQFILPPGLGLLVLPALPVVVISFFSLLALGLLPFASVFSQGRKSKSIPTPAVAASISPESSSTKTVSSEELFRNWVKDAINLAPDTTRESPPWLRQRPAVFIGLGSAGEHVIKNLASHLEGRMGIGWNTRATHIRLMHIGASTDTAETGAQGPTENPLGYTSLSLNLDRDKRSRLLWHDGLNWFDQRRINTPGRAVGR